MVTLYDLAKGCVSEERAKVIARTNGFLNSPVTSFSDPRIIATQTLIDYFLYEQGKHPYTLDITQFFRLNEPFSVGYQLAEDVIAPVINHSVSKDSEKPEYKDILACYVDVLKTGQIVNILNYTLMLSQRGSKKSASLLERTFMQAPKESPLFTDKKVVVTGSDTGIGREIALEFARRGANVVLHYPTEMFVRGAMSAVELIREYKGCAQAYSGDFRTIQGINDFARDAFKDGVDILVNNAGITLCKSIEDTTEQDLLSVVFVNELAPYLLSQAAIKIMKQQKSGAIINMSSNHGLAGTAGHTAYAMTKAGVLGLTRPMAMETRDYNVRVNTLIPGAVITESHLRLMPDFSERGKNVAIGHWNNPIDVAKAACFLASDDAKNMMGSILPIDGGISASQNLGEDATKIPSISFGERFLRD